MDKNHKGHFVILTEPISVNALYTGRRFLTSKGRDTKYKIAREVLIQLKGHEIIKDKFALEISFFLKDNKKDIDGLLKGLLDSLNKILWEDDRQIVELRVFKKVDKERPRTELRIL